MPRRQPERHEQRAIVDLVRLIGGRVWVLGTTRRRGDHPGTMQTPGLADLWIVLPAHPAGFAATALWWEVKAHGGRRTPEQVAFGDACLDSGIAYGYGDLEAFLDWLTAEGRLDGRRRREG